MNQIARRSFMGLSLAALATAALQSSVVSISTARAVSIASDTPGRVVGTISFEIDQSALTEAAHEFADLLEELAPSFPDRFRDALFEFCERAEYLIKARIECGPAHGAGKSINRVILQPSDFFSRLLAALRAHDFDIGVFVDFHDSSSVGLVRTSNEERALTESQGSVGACPPSTQGEA